MRNYEIDGGVSWLVLLVVYSWKSMRGMRGLTTRLAMVVDRFLKARMFQLEARLLFCSLSLGLG